MRRNSKFLLIIQWQTSESFDFDQLIEREEAVAAALGEDGNLDGHDMGSGEANVFVFTDQPEALFKKLRETALRDDLSDVKAAYRRARGERYTVLWPPGESEFEVK